MSDFKGMTLHSIYKQGECLLRKANIPDSDFDALCLLEHYFGTDRTALIIHGDRPVGKEPCERFLAAINERISGKPLQYILGKWSFMGFDFFVGEGVLIPRDDTETTVEAALDFLRARKPSKPEIIDLCSGSGAIAVSIARLFPDSVVTALEYSDSAFEYLKRNIGYNHADNVTAYKGDVTTCFDDFEEESFDMIISNPPYIQSDEIVTLQPELMFEPRMALDGGSDGLYFYNSITEHWSSKLKKGGMLAYEVGEEQYAPVSRLMENKGFTNICYKRDLQGYNRTVCGIKS